jgi:phosphinothricin acetyltransferase
MTVFRPAMLKDLGAINALYNDYILNSVATFDLEPISLPDKTRWFEQFDERGRSQLWVALEDTVFMGFAASQPFRPKAGYRNTVETGIYITPSAVGKGYGTALYRHLFLALDATPVTQAIAIVTRPNPASVKLHKQLGFQTVGELTDVGEKFGVSQSVYIMQRTKAE